MLAEKPPRPLCGHLCSLHLVDFQLQRPPLSEFVVGLGLAWKRFPGQPVNSRPLPSFLLFQGVPVWACDGRHFSA